MTNDEQRPAVVHSIKAEEDNQIAYDPSGKDWAGIKAAAAREARDGYIQLPYFGDAVPTTQERIAPRGILTEWADKTSRPSLWCRGD